MKRIALAILLLATPAAAQVAEKTYTLTVTRADLGIIAEGLGEVPSKRANPIIAKLNSQIQGQDAPDKPAEDKPKP